MRPETATTSTDPSRVSTAGTVYAVGKPNRSASSASPGASAITAVTGALNTPLTRPNAAAPTGTPATAETTGPTENVPSDCAVDQLVCWPTVGTITGEAQ
ncbi:MAG: hypothetical protein M3424_10340 [Actinomycetota bacterium]|nr:hypothetical protein [Actinomycetota bacterium]